MDSTKLSQIYETELKKWFSMVDEIKHIAEKDKEKKLSLMWESAKQLSTTSNILERLIESEKKI